MCESKPSLFFYSSKLYFFSIGYSDLVDAGMTSSLMDRPLLETRRGHSQNMREIPPSVFAIAIDVHLHKPPALTVDISRPVKLTLTPQMITKLSEFSDPILKSIESQHGTKPLNAPTATEDTKSSEESVTKDEMETQELQREKNNPTPPAFSGAVDSTGNSVQVKLKVMQVLVEFQISTRCMDLADGDNDRELCASIGEEMEAEPTVAEEGFILAWDHLDLAYPNISGTDFIILLHNVSSYLCLICLCSSQALLCSRLLLQVIFMSVVFSC